MIDGLLGDIFVEGNLVTWRSKKTKCRCSLKCGGGIQRNDTWNMRSIMVKTSLNRFGLST
ncbi:hypothetical protein MTR67_018094 [Solanum verrucosum]|uniref:Uncharacterized protein n=1 Tax=Solanum verrucosum TaxID=315347 RepID=A0AAF0QRI9_SOLVR|nr:hypothetical protein MTR67_018094 [Solanum verrucosum]